MLPQVTARASASGLDKVLVVVTPHQDDEMRLTSYLTRIADQRDRIIQPVCVTDGSSTNVRNRLGLTREQCTRWRDREQDASFDWLTDGWSEPVIRLGFTDGASDREEVRYALDVILNRYEGMEVEVYCATWHPDRPESTPSDLNVDHVATALAVRDVTGAHGVVARYARHYHQWNLGGAGYLPASTQQFNRIEGAVGSYVTIGQRSAGYAFRMVLDSGGYCKVTS